MLEHPPQILANNRPTDIRSLYETHAGMLLGYIYDVVKDHRVAEDYLEKIFSAVSIQFDDINWNGTSTWCQLQRFAKNQLLAFTAEKQIPSTTTTALNNQYSNAYLDQLSDLQKQVFCAIYYEGKSTASLSAALHQTEDSIRKALREAFAIIRKERGN
ncbi:hypothetical protein PBAL39_24700 [Pedobacter sp. BAL39]|uniref:RNA polymerase sigma factor n=1 Tax=Pedobacter sp. BAL39 TaxID=391596 RepID=UPI0001559BF0|nr:sigma-70 family RNA polymerase sigma factor [Pedobacter sp. BAL39]EDM36526.1 hypothetical protein PBAL39_24700 [Pedobacter sp. BAL39]